MIDASVALKWYIPDESFTVQALALRDAHLSGVADCLAPYFSRHEVASGLIGAVRTRKMSLERAAQQLDSYLTARLTAPTDDPLFSPALALAMRLPVSTYDALYMALAEAADAYFITADDRLRRGLAGRFPRLVWIGDISL